MKSLILVLSLISSVAFAGTPSEETASVVEVLLDNPTVITTLQKEGTVHLANLDINQDKTTSVNTYNMLFVRGGFSLPTTVSVEITQDLKPTFADGAPIYTSKISVAR